ncbi:MAG: hypothetical protein IPN84_04820 [Sphingomonadales bacterium]|nr:hypothetical protein [Sphingomonadales bacterium]
MGSHKDTLLELKAILQKLKPRQFEQLAASLIGRLLDVPIAVAKSGFQFGGDAGSAGRAQRSFRIETKRYGDNTSLSDRELLGEIDHAIARDSGLEGWFLVATREVPEQLEMDLADKSAKVGVPVIVIDWKPATTPGLAALCTVAPEIVGSTCGEQAEQIVRSHINVLSGALTMLKHELQSWSLGFEGLRLLAQAKLDEVWNTPASAVASLGQDVAGGARNSTIRRVSSFARLSHWWQSGLDSPAPAVVCGMEGYGKTWATVDWLVDRQHELPIVLLLPASRFASATSPTETAIKSIIAECLFELAKTRGVEHWKARLERLLARPNGEGPVLILCLDGMNQEPGVPWLRALQCLQANPFAGRIRVIATTRKHHFEERLNRLSSLIAHHVIVEVSQFTNETGGELDQRLAHDNLTRDDLHPDLLPFARTPRLYDLVIRLRDRLDTSTEVTVHRLLWEYGRDTLGVRGGNALTESEWKTWLSDLANRYRTGAATYSFRELGELAAQADLTESDVYRRLSEIVDGHFVKQLPSGKYKLSDQTVAHALGLALLNHLEEVQSPTQTSVEIALAQWLDPISGLDERSEILRAAVSIMLAQGRSIHNAVVTELVAAWLSTQNLAEDHRTELIGLAKPLLRPLLDVLERESHGAYHGARLLALEAIRNLPRDDDGTLAIIVERATNWLSIFSRDVDPPSRRNDESEKHRSDHLKKRIGRDEDGVATILGLKLQIVERGGCPGVGEIPALLEGFPLSQARSIFEHNALVEALTMRSGIWEELKWVVLLNPIDFEATCDMLKALSDDFLARTPESGVHPDLNKRVAALLLWMSGDEALESEAVLVDPKLDAWRSYEEDYLPDPSNSWYRLERRHIDEVMSNHGLPLFRRIDRAKHFWFDPAISVPPVFAEDLTAAADQFDLSNVYVGRGHTREDHDLEQLVIPMARFAPGALVGMIRRKLAPTKKLDESQRQALSNHAIEHFILNDDEIAAALGKVRRRRSPANAGEKSYVNENFMLFEVASLGANAQFELFLDARQKYISYDPQHVLKAPSQSELDSLIARFGQRKSKAQSNLVALLSLVEPQLSETVWQWLLDRALDPGFELCGVACKILNRVAATRFGQKLLECGWSWKPGGNDWVNHYGSHAVIEASMAMPFEQIASVITPSLLPYAVRERGSERSDTQLAAEILSSLLMSSTAKPADAGAEIFVNAERRESDPVSFSILPPPMFPDDPLGDWRAMSQPDEHARHRQSAVDTAVERIRDARVSGARLFIHSFSSEDFAPFIVNHRDKVMQWIEGYADESSEFRRRVRLAEGAFIALCDAMFEHDPRVGSSLWTSLRNALHTRFIGHGKVDEMIHVVFKHAALPEAAALLDELYNLPQCHTDAALFTLALAAQLNDQGAWLEKAITADESSDDLWHRQRARVMNGFRSGNQLPFPDSGDDTVAPDLRTSRQQKMLRWQHREACAKHWWESYWNAKTIECAYAAWVLFSNAADRRAHCWMMHRLKPAVEGDQLTQKKLCHFRLNYDRLTRAMEKHEKDLDREFLGRRIKEGIGPWHS